jgi:hypothetical protein
LVSYAICITLGTGIVYLIFKPIYEADSLIFPYAIHQFDICKVYPDTWIIIKKLYFVMFWLAFSIIFIKIFRKIKFKPKELKVNQMQDFLENENLKLIVGTDKNNNLIEIEENRIISKYIYNRNNREWKNKLGYVSIYFTTYGVQGL